MNFKEALKEIIAENPTCPPPEELHGPCSKYAECSDCRKLTFEKLLELLERDYVEKERDTLEKVERDARLSTEDYWKCKGFYCCDCPALIDGKTPLDFYEITACDKAQRLDLLRRQRELLEG